MKRSDCLFNQRDDTYRVQQLLNNGGVIDSEELFISKNIIITPQSKGKLMNCSIHLSNHAGFHWENNETGTVWNVKVEDYMYACAMAQT